MRILLFMIPGVYQDTFVQKLRVHLQIKGFIFEESYPSANGPSIVIKCPIFTIEIRNFYARVLDKRIGSCEEIVYIFDAPLVPAAYELERNGVCDSSTAIRAILAAKASYSVLVRIASQSNVNVSKLTILDISKFDKLINSFMEALFLNFNETPLAVANQVLADFENSVFFQKNDYHCVAGLNFPIHGDWNLGESLALKLNSCLFVHGKDPSIQVTQSIDIGGSPKIIFGGPYICLPQSTIRVCFNLYASFELESKKFSISIFSGQELLGTHTFSLGWTMKNEIRIEFFNPSATNPLDFHFCNIETINSGEILLTEVEISSS